MRSTPFLTSASARIRPPVRACSDILDGDNDEGVELAGGVADGDIFTWVEHVVGELEAGFVVFLAGEVVVKGPGAAGAMDEMADVFLLAAPETDDAAAVAVFLPGLGVEMAGVVERRAEAV